MLLACPTLAVWMFRGGSRPPFVLGWRSRFCEEERRGKAGKVRSLDDFLDLGVMLGNFVGEDLDFV